MGRWGGPQEGYKNSSGPGLWQELQARGKRLEELESDLARRAPLQGKGRRIASHIPPAPGRGMREVMRNPQIEVIMRLLYMWKRNSCKQVSIGAPEH